MFNPGKPFQPSLMFADKVVANLSEAPFRYSTIGQGPGLTHKRLTRLERLALAFYKKSVNYGRKSFIGFSPVL